MKKRIAVSVLLARHHPSQELLLVSRNPELKFFGGYLAFPGGTLEEQDEGVEVREIPEYQGRPQTEDLPAFIAAAARELFEETGIWLGRGGSPPDEGRLAEARRLLLAGRLSFPRLLSGMGAWLDGRDFTPVCRITTPPFSPLRYDTWFLSCRLPPGQQVDIWPGELEEGRFWNAGTALSHWRRGEVLIAPPNLILLEVLSRSDSLRFLSEVRRLTQSYDRGKLHRVFFSCGVLLAPLLTRTRPPATHTNCYVVGEERLFVVDPASSDPGEQEKLWELLDELKDEGRKLQGVILTHYHPDHTGAAAECARRYHIDLFTHEKGPGLLPSLPISGFLREGQELDLGSAPDGTPGWRLKVYHCPGHSPDHLVLQENRYQAVVVGDLVSTLSPILIDPSDGDLALYMNSLKRLESLAEQMLYPGHGPPQREGRRAVQKTIRHRQEREAQIIQALRSGNDTVERLLESVYQDVDAQLMGLAERSLGSALIKLQREDRLRVDGGRLTLLEERAGPAS